MEYFLSGMERVKRFVNVHSHYIVSNLKTISKMSTLPRLEKLLRTPMETHLHFIFAVILSQNF